MLDDFIERLGNWKSTLLGVVTLVLLLLLKTGVIGVEANDFITQNLNGFWEGLITLLTTIAGILAIVSKWRND